MQFSSPLLEGEFIKRYKRFFADVQLDASTVVAHVANTGSLKGLVDGKKPCLLMPSDNPERKLKYTLIALKENETFVGIHTQFANGLAKEAFEKKLFPHWEKFTHFQSEVKINSETRLDVLLTNESGKKHYVEIKNVTLKTGTEAQFPDTKTERGVKHLKELMALIDPSTTAEILFLVQRSDCESFSAASHIDPEYAKTLQLAISTGVRATAAVADVSPTGIQLTNRFLPIR